MLRVACIKPQGLPEEATLPQLQIILQNIGPGVNPLTLNRLMTTENGDLTLGNRYLSPRGYCLRP